MMFGFRGIGLPVPVAPPSGITWLLRDDFTDTRAAGAVNGTAPTPGPGTRVATDTGNNLSISSGAAIIAATVSAGDPLLGYSVPVVRTPGRVIISRINTSPTSLIFGLGNASGAVATETYFSCAPTILSVKMATSGVQVATPAYPLDLAIALRSTSEHFFAKIGGNWLLVGISTGHSTGTLYATRYTGGGTANLGRIVAPIDLWLPTPLASDGFGSTFGSTDGLGHAEGIAGGIGSGGGGLAWTHTTYSVSAAKAINTPTLGSELLADGGFENWTTSTNVTNWTENIAGTSTINRETVDAFSGSNAVRMDIDSSSSIASIYQTAVSVGKWYHLSVYAKASTTGKTMKFSNGASGDLGPTLPTLTTSYAQYFATARATTTEVGIKRSSAASSSIYLDSFSVKEIPLAELFSSVVVSTADVLAETEITLTTTTTAGLVLNLDNASSPASFVIAYHDGTNCKLEKCVAGVYTSVVSAAATYSAGAVLRVSKIGTAYRLYYNNALVGTGTISDAGIINNARHGLFSTYSGNQLDNFVVYASGSNGEYAILNQYVD